MKGKYDILVENDMVKYEFSLQRNITILQGDSATGKTALIDMINEYFLDPISSGIKIKSDKKCIVLEGPLWSTILDSVKDSFVFIDEGNKFLFTDEFANKIKNTDNYYIIATRVGLENLPYSINEIYGIRDSGKYIGTKKIYNELYNIYPEYSLVKDVSFDKIITEDSNSGFDFFASVCKEKNKLCDSANGKSNIEKMINKKENCKRLFIADGAAFGSQVDKVMQALKYNKNTFLYLPESFEWLLLNSGILRDKQLEKILEAPFMYIESAKYFSWERFFTHLLIEKTQDTPFAYNKKTLNQIFLQKENKTKILKAMKFTGF